MKISLIIIIGVFALAGCITTYYHPAKNAQDFDRDANECQDKAQRQSHFLVFKPLCEETKRCLEEEKGWQRVK